MDGMSAPRQDWPRLAAAIKERREQLRVTQADIQAAGGPSAATLYKLENAGGDRYQPRILRALAHSLQWPDEMIDHVLSGGDPAALVDTDEPTADELIASATAPPEQPPPDARVIHRQVQIGDTSFERVDRVWEKQEGDIWWVHVARYADGREIVRTALGREPDLTVDDLIIVAQRRHDETERMMAEFKRNKRTQQRGDA